MSYKWKTVRIGDLGKVITGKTPSTAISENFGGDYPFITIPDLDGRREITDSARTLSELGAQVLRSCRLPRDAVMMSCIATIGKCGITTKDGFTNQQINSLICKDGIDPRFVYYSFTQLGKALEAAGGGGSVYTNVSKSRFEAIEIKLPSLKEQKFVAAILGKLDDKIDINRRINQTLESMAQAIFKSWFVDFDPVKARIAAKQEGRDPLRAAMSAISGKPDTELDALPPEQYAQLAAIAALFPDEMDESALGEIPRGWAVGTIGDLAKVTIGGDWGKDQPENEQYVQAICLRGVDLEHLRTGGDCPKAPVRWVKSSSIEKRQIQSTDLLIGGSGAGPCGRPLYASSLIAGLVDHPVIYSNFVKRFRCNNSSIAIYLDSILWGLFDSGAIQNYINGTSVPNLNDKGLLTHLIILPDNQILNEFEKISENWLRTLYSSGSRTLAVLRDTLLPKLLSGELSVTNAMSEVEA